VISADAIDGYKCVKVWCLFVADAGIAVASVRRSGGLPAFQQLNNYLLYSEMIIPASNYWNVVHGSRPSEVLKDDEGVQILRVAARNLIWVLRLIENGKGQVAEPEKVHKVFTNFIR